LIFHTNGRTQVEGIREQGSKEDTWA